MRLSTTSTSKTQRKVNYFVQCKRCILYSTPSKKFTNVCKISVGRKPPRILVPYFWSRPGAKTIHKTAESTNELPEKTEDSSDNLHRRYSNSGSRLSRNPNGKGLSTCRSTVSRIHNKPEKVRTTTIKRDGVPRVPGKQRGPDTDSARRESAKFNETVHRNAKGRKPDSKRAGRSHREAKSNLTCIHPCTAADKIPAADPGQSGRARMTICLSGQFGRKGKTGAAMVVRKYLHKKWKTIELRTPSVGHLNRRGKDRGMGSRMQRTGNRRTLDVGGRQLPHKRTGDGSSQEWPHDLHKNHEGVSSSLTGGQHGSNLLHRENGGNQEHQNARDSKRNLAISHVEKDHSYCRVYPIRTQRGRGLGIQKLA